MKSQQTWNNERFNLTIDAYMCLCPRGNFFYEYTTRSLLFTKIRRFFPEKGHINETVVISFDSDCHCFNSHA